MSDEVSIPNGLPRPFSLIDPVVVQDAIGFQSQTGFPGHLAERVPPGSHTHKAVSIPNGLPRPFSLIRVCCRSRLIGKFQSQTGFPGHLAFEYCSYQGIKWVVSIPNGLPRPFSPNKLGDIVIQSVLFQSQTGFPGHLAGTHSSNTCRTRRFQSQTGFPGHLARHLVLSWEPPLSVSIPNGLPRPFSRCYRS